MAYRGKFRPKNRDKYKGDIENIVYRSSWELKFFHYCDRSPSIIKWNSESIIIPYYYLGKKHRYFPDVWIRYVSHDGKINQKLIEIKPYIQKYPPKQKKNRGKYLRELDTYAKNQAKWAAAKIFCERNHIEWDVYDEYDLQIKAKSKRLLAEERKLNR